MAPPSKVFRIETTGAVRPDPPAGEASAGWGQPELNEALAALRTMPAAAEGGSPHRDAAAQLAASRLIEELAAVVNGTAQATEKILAATEAIDRIADDLTALLSGKIEGGFAADIREYTIEIFEACNFQDLIGQRITKVMAGLQTMAAGANNKMNVGAPVAAGARHTGDCGPAMHGPQLDGDDGHVSQADIDAMFGGAASSEIVSD